MLLEWVERYCNAYGPTGHERPIMDLLSADWAKATPELTPVGNLIGHVPAKGPKLLIETHADEIALMVKSITASGFLRVTLGTWGSELQFPPSPWAQMQRVKVKGRDKWVDGIVGLATGHVRTTEQNEKAKLDWTDIFVDIGTSDRAGVEALGIEIGSPIVFASELQRLGHYITGKALDARAALAIMTEFLRRLDPADLRYDLYLAATVQEEMHLIGAGSLGRRAYDLAIGVEVGLAGDIPTVDPLQMPTRLGGGPVILIKDRVVHYDVALTTRIKRVAKIHGIPYQPAVFQAFSSDIKELVVRGIPSALLAFPTRYTHTPWETASLDDMENIVRLLLAFVSQDDVKSYDGVQTYSSAK